MITDDELIDYIYDKDLTCNYCIHSCDCNHAAISPDGNGMPIYAPCCDGTDCIDLESARQELEGEIIMNKLEIKQIIFNKPATIILWRNGDKTVVKCQKGDKFDKEKGIALCFMKYVLGNKSNFNEIIKENIKEN